MAGKEPGDPEKLVQVVIDLVKGEGAAAGRDLPLRIPLGTDAVNAIRKKCVDTLKILEDWSALTVSTDYATKSQNAADEIVKKVRSMEAVPASA